MPDQELRVGIAEADRGLRHPARRWRWARVFVVVAAVIGLAVVGLRGRLPAPQDVFDATTGIVVPWALLAAALQATSIAAFALQHRRLFDGLGVRIGLPRTTAVVLAGTALTNTVPGGAAVATAYTVREFGRAGASHEVSAASAVVSGLASIGGLTVLYVGGGLVVVSGGPAWRPLLMVLGLAAMTVVAVAAGRRYTGQPPRHIGEDDGDSRATRYARTAARWARNTWRAAAGLRTRDWASVLAYATAKWVADLLCLVAVVHALGLPVTVTALAGIYLSVQVVRQVPLTPGAIGVVETAFVAGLTAAGAASAPAAAAVLIYRLLSCWLLIPVGAVAALLLRRMRQAPAV